MILYVPYYFEMNHFLFLLYPFSGRAVFMPPACKTKNIMDWELWGKNKKIKDI